MYCSSCGSSISDKAEICPNCGVRPFTEKFHCYGCGASVNANQEMCIECGTLLAKSAAGKVNGTIEPWIAAILSLLFTGLGQIVLGQVNKGIALLAITLISGTFTFGFSLIIMIPLTIVDAFLIAKKKASGKQVEDWEFF